jgi:hypothetical protein
MSPAEAKSAAYRRIMEALAVGYTEESTAIDYVMTALVEDGCDEALAWDAVHEVWGLYFSKGAA